MRRRKPHPVILPRRCHGARSTLRLDAQSCYSLGIVPSRFQLLLKFLSGFKEKGGRLSRPEILRIFLDPSLSSGLFRLCR
jgi:hypothetical protein